MTGPEITGRTAILFILGDPVVQIIGSAEMNRAFAGWGLDIAVSPLHVRPGDLADCLSLLRRTANVAGFSLTVPHKIAVVPLLDRLTDAARLAGAVNFVRREADGSLTGTNMDGAGFVQGLRDRGVDPAGQSVLQIGAGGVARAIAFGLAAAGAGRITLTNRTRPRAEALAADMRAAFPDVDVTVCDGTPDLSRHSLVVNTTTVGMGDADACPVDPQGLTDSTVVADVILTPPVTRLLAVAAETGCRTVPGKAMLRPQARLVAEFLGMAPR
ncbi:shikimate dehydrogenase family protein [Salipiger sp.]|uniref:shikimate dehydrogenase family protein n=1 Tax=Salipiger sp. TaxID=2078585 RepID=UPI003A98159C